MPSFWSLLLLFFAPLQLVYSLSLVNVTIDDSYPDPVTGAQVAYTPDLEWNFGTVCNSCPRPSPSQARNGKL